MKSKNGLKNGGIVVDKRTLERIENEIILKGIESGQLSVQRNKIVPLRGGKLQKTDFGLFIGKEFEYDKLLSINYYEYFKLSSGILRAVDAVKDIFCGVRSIKANIIHFTSIHPEVARQIADDDKLFLEYIDLKKYLLELRFNKKSRSTKSHTDTDIKL
jgi:hypothetical protein